MHPSAKGCHPTGHAQTWCPTGFGPWTASLHHVHATSEPYHQPTPTWPPSLRWWYTAVHLFLFSVAGCPILLYCHYRERSARHGWIRTTSSLTTTRLRCLLYTAPHLRLSVQCHHHSTSVAMTQFRVPILVSILMSVLVWTLEQHVKNICRVAFLNIHNIWKIRPFLSESSACVLVYRRMSPHALTTAIAFSTDSPSQFETNSNVSRTLLLVWSQEQKTRAHYPHPKKS